MSQRYEKSTYARKYIKSRKRDLSKPDPERAYRARQRAISREMFLLSLLTTPLLCPCCGRPNHPCYWPRCEDCWALAMSHVFGSKTSVLSQDTVKDFSQHNSLASGKRHTMKGWM